MSDAEPQRTLLGTVLSAAGWMGLLAFGALLGFGERWGVSLMPVPGALGMAACGALSVAPLTGDRGYATPYTAACSAIVAAIAGGSAAWVWRTQPASPWTEGAVLLGLHWTALAAAAAFGLGGGVLTARSWIGDPEEHHGPTPSDFLASARNAALRATLLLWVGWYTAGLVHARFLASPGVGSRSEWFALGTTLLATGGLLVGWDLGDDRVSKLRATIGPIWVAIVVVAGIWLSFGFGSPFGLSLGS